MKRIILSGVAAASLLAGTAHAAALVVFGDSTVDAGAAQAASLANGFPNPTPAELGYFQGRFSNGLNTADYVNQVLNGTPTTNFLQGGTNYAFGGAAIVTDLGQGPGGNPVGIPDLTDQVDLFLANGPIAADTDVFLSVGGNDFLAAARGVGDASDIGMAALSDLTAQLRRLAEAGATNIAVSNVNASGFALGGATELAAAVEAYNDALAAALIDLSATTGARFSLVDRDAVFDRIIADPLAFGFDPALLGRACINDQSAVPDCDGYVLFDPIHTTTRAQELVAVEVLAALRGAEVPLPAAAWLFLGGAAVFRAARRV